MSPVDTVARAAAEADLPQPFAELGLTRDEYEKIVATLGRRPTGAELALYSVMWSEHCSYKSSKVHLRQFAAKAPPSGALLAGIGHNAGVVDIGQGYAVTFKIESHNHPSYVEPHQGAATGVGGIVRDILAMGARPVGGDGRAAVRPGRRARHRPGAARRGRRHLLLRELPGPAQHRRGTRLRPELRGQSAGQRALRGGHAARRPAGRGGQRAGQQGDPVRVHDRARRRGRGLGAGQRDVRRRRCGRHVREAPQRAGGGSVPGEAAGRVLPRALRGRPGDRHPGPRRGRGRLRDHRARRGGHRRHAGPAGRGAAAGPVAGAARDLDERVAGTHDGGRRARPGGGVPRRLRQVGRPGRRDRRGDRTPAGWS